MLTGLLTTTTPPSTIVMAVCIILGTLVILYSIYNIKQSQKHIPNTKRVGKKILSASPKGARLFSNKAYLFDNEYKAIDIVLADNFGVVIVKVFENANEVYGKPKSEKWKIINGDLPHSIPNPLVELEETFEKIRKVFAANAVYNIPIEALIVFADATQKTDIYVDTLSPVIKYDGIRSFFAKRNVETKPVIEIKGVIKVFEDISSEIKA